MQSCNLSVGFDSAYLRVGVIEEDRDGGLLEGGSLVNEWQSFTVWGDYCLGFAKGARLVWGLTDKVVRSQRETRERERERWRGREGDRE